MAGLEPFTAVLSVLRRCYAEAVPLETFVRRLGGGGAGYAQVLRAHDGPGYRTFVGQCLVCVPRGARAIPRPFTFQQLSSQSEVTARIVQRLCEKKKKNVLAYGYSLPHENSSQFPVMPFSKIHSYLPNTVTETLRISGFWETLLSRIGDDVMMYLLEHCAIFMLVPPSNCYQVCGQPVYELISCNVDSSLVFVRQRVSKPKCTSLLTYMRKRLAFHRNYLLKSYRWKYRQRCKDNVYRMRNEGSNERRSLVPLDQCSEKAVSEGSKQIRMVTEHQEKLSGLSSCVSVTASSLNRKIHREQPKISAKRAKKGEKVRKKKACNLVPDVNQSSSERSATGCVSAATNVAPQSESVINPPHISCVSVTAPSRKRKIDRGQPEIPAKRAKKGEKVRKKKACNLAPDVNQSSSERSATGCVSAATNVAPQSESVINPPHISCVSVTAPSLNRKIHREQPEIPAKRAKKGKKVRKKKACNLVRDVNQNSSERSATGCVSTATYVAPQSESVINPPHISCVSVTAPSLNRKIDRGQPEIPAKRAKIGQKVRKNKVCSSVPDVNQSSSERSATGCVSAAAYVAPRSGSVLQAPHISERSNNVVSSPSLVHTSHGRRKSVVDKSSLLQGVQSNEPLESNTETQAESHRRRIEMYMYQSQLATGRIIPRERTSGCRGQESPQRHLSKKLPNRLLSSAVYIERKSLLYSCRSFQECFPKSFVLNRLQGSRAVGRWLIEAIFSSQGQEQQRRSQSLPQRKRRRKSLPKRYRQMRPTFQKLLKKHGKCAYLALLRKNCPVRISETSMRQIKLSCQAALPGEAEVQKQAEQFGKQPAKCVTSGSCDSGHTDVPDSLGTSLGESVDGVSLPSEEQNLREAGDSALRELLKQHSSHWQVYMFVRSCLQKVIPYELWGSNHNKCRFLKNVKMFIAGGRSKVSLLQLMRRMRVNDCIWLRLGKGDHFVPADEHCFREELLAKFLYWLMGTYVVELLRSFFYITETMFQKNMLFYYRKFIWGKLQNIGIRNHFVKVQLRPLSSEEIETIHQRKVVTMASKLRFIPKPNGLRPIVKVGSVVGPQALSKESREKKVNHYNTQLKNLFSVLNYERTINTSFLGSSVFGKDDIYKRWKQFVTKILESGDEIPHFYCVKADVSRAYDTIPHNKLVEVISRVLKPEKRTVYCIRRYAVVMVTPSGRVKKLFRRHVSTFKDFMPDMKQFVSHLQESASLQNAMVVEQSLTFSETSSSLFNFFLQMMRNSILEIRNRYYLQCCGIPQGSILSNLLCSLFYGDMENQLFSGIQQDGVLIRFIDDFLLLTPHLMKAKYFLRTLITGIPEYGLLINPNKTVVNFPVDDIPGCSKFKQLPDCRLIPWCGLLLDIKTLEVYCDYSSYTCTSIRSSLYFNSSITAGENMKYKLIAVLKLKCHGLFLDLQINSLRTVLINIYKIFFLQAYRFHACVLQFPFNQEVRKNPDFFLRIISQTASCCYGVLKTINAGIAEGNKDVSRIFPIEVAEWLCYHAFTVKLSNHKAVYQCLIKSLKVCKSRLIRRIPEDTVALLQAVTEPSICKDFKAILD